MLDILRSLTVLSCKEIVVNIERLCRSRIYLMGLSYIRLCGIRLLTVSLFSNRVVPGWACPLKGPLWLRAGRLSSAFRQCEIPYFFFPGRFRFLLQLRPLLLVMQTILSLRRCSFLLVVVLRRYLSPVPCIDRSILVLCFVFILTPVSPSYSIILHGVFFTPVCFW